VSIALPPTLIGISGPNGSGKDSVGHALGLRHAYLFISVTDLLRQEAAKRGLEAGRDTLRTISAEWRRSYGYGVLVDRAITAYTLVSDQYSGLAMASLRNPAEADRIHELGGTVIWVDADPQIRYDRIQANAQLRNRGQEDNKTFAEFQAEEVIEMTRAPGADGATLDMQSVKDRADYSLTNNGADLELFYHDIDVLLGFSAA
jgi:cytidylate kinase